jgi:hypothetical protein
MVHALMECKFLINSSPSKLFKLKKWLTLSEASKHLTGACGEEVTEADILLLALEKHLTLSVNFVNHAHVIQKKIVYFDEEKLRKSILQGIFPPEFRFADMPFSNDKLMLARRIDEGKFLTSEEEDVVDIQGIWDLPMIGGEEILLLSKYHELTAGPPVDLVNIDGCFVAQNDNVICELQDSFDDNEDYYDYRGYRARLRVQVDKLRLLKQNKTNSPRKEKILLLRSEKVKKHYEMLDEWDKKGKYFSAVGLPEDTVLVVRTEALREFEQRISEIEPEKNAAASNKLDKAGLSETERRTLLKLVLGMAIDAYGYDQFNSRNRATGDKDGISAKLQTRGINIDADTIRKYLTEAKNIL